MENIASLKLPQSSTRALAWDVKWLSLRPLWMHIAKRNATSEASDTIDTTVATSNESKIEVLNKMCSETTK